MDLHIKPPRIVGLAGATLLNLNAVVGAGIFALPALLYASAGTFAPLAILVFALIFAALAAVYAQLSTLFEQSGGAQIYGELAFGRFAGFQVGWLFLGGNLVSRAANFHVLVSYLAALFPVFAGEVIRPLTIIALIALTTFVSMVGTRKSIDAVWLGTAGKLVPLMLLAVAGLAINGLPQSVKLPQFTEVEAIALLLAYAFSGADAATVSAGETRDPRKILFRATFLNIAIVALFYALIQLAYMVIDPADPDLEAPLASAGAALFGYWGTVLVSIAAIFSTGTNQLSYFVVMPRLIYGMSRRGLLPQILSYVSERWQTPSVAIGFYGFVVAALSLTGGFVVLATLMVAIDQVINFAMIAALVVLWRRNEGGIGDRMGPGWAAIILVAFGFATWLALQVPPSAVLSTALLLAIGAALYFALHRDQGEKIIVAPERGAEH